MNQRELRLMNLAKDLTSLSSHPNYHLAALLVKSNKVVSKGINRLAPKPHFVKRNKHGGDMGKHAEVDCLMFLDKSVTKGCSLYVAGRSKAGNLLLTIPCGSCMLVIRKMGVKKVYFHDTLGNLGMIKL